MFKFKHIALAAAALGFATLSTAAEAQYYYHPQYGWVQQQQRQVWVSPKVARKQAQLRERFIEKYGYQQPQRGYGHGYGHQGYGRGYGHAYGHRPHHRHYYQQPQQQYYGGHGQFYQW